MNNPLTGVLNTLMNNVNIVLKTVFTALLVCSTGVYAQKDSKFTVFQLDIKEEIAPGIARQTSKALEESIKRKADLVLIHLNTYGGLVDAADSIRTAILNHPVPVVVFIDNNAASAGALISIACDSIYMRKGGNIGAATVVNQEAEALPDKYQSYMRSMMRSTAEATGRNPRIAEAMVDPRVYIEGVNDSGKVLTLTASEAIPLGYCNALAEDVAEVLSLYGIKEYNLIRFEPSWTDKLIGWLIHPAVSGVLILIMLGGLYYELQQPGIGFPLALAVAAAVLYFAPLYLEGLAANWEILVSILGLALLAVELFLLPGFGVAGIAGITLLVFGLFTSMLRNDGLDFSGVSGIAIASSLAIVMTGMAGALLLFVLASRILSDSPLFKKLVLQTEMSSSEGYRSVSALPAVGSRGITATLLRPSGKVRIEDVLYSAGSESGFLETGTEIEVVSIMGGTLVVRPIQAS
jgi:membrane-bound serine protease (ClpP class)